MILTIRLTRSPYSYRDRYIARYRLYRACSFGRVRALLGTLRGVLR